MVRLHACPKLAQTIYHFAGVMMTTDKLKNFDINSEEIQRLTTQFKSDLYTACLFSFFSF